MMENKPDQPVVEEDTLGVEGADCCTEDGACCVEDGSCCTETEAAVEATPEATPEPAAKAPLTADEIRATLTDAKTQIVEVGLAPVTAALASWSETIRDTVSGALSGLLSNKKKDGS